MNTSDFAIPWPKALATELQVLCANRLSIKLGRQHSMEIISACFNKKYASLVTDGRTVAETPDIPQDIAWEYVEERIHQLMPTLSAIAVSDIKSIIEHIWVEEITPEVALVKRLARNVVENCQYDERFGFAGSALLTEHDWSKAGQVASGSNFREGMAVQLPFPTIAPFAQAKPLPECEYRYQMEPGCVLNVMAFLAPDDWDEYIARYK